MDFGAVPNGSTKIYFIMFNECYQVYFKQRIEMTSDIKRLINSCDFIDNHVKINEERLYQFCDLLKNEYIPLECKRSTDKIRVSIYKSILDASLQFCFWYGNSNVRINGNSSGKISELVDNYCYDLNILKKQIRLARFPMIDERMRIIDDIGPMNSNKMRKVVAMIAHAKTVDNMLTILNAEFTSFSDDILMKKAFLAIMLIHCKTNLLNDPENILVPADYQIPKMLRSYEILEYSLSLSFDVDRNGIIERNSEEELSIRMQTINAVSWISNITGINSYEIDQFFFSQRHLCKDPHHLTLTTAY